MIKKLCRLSSGGLRAADAGGVELGRRFLGGHGDQDGQDDYVRQGIPPGQEDQARERHGRGKQIVIVRPDKKLVWIIFPSTKTYMESGQRSDIDIAKLTNPSELRKHGTVKSLGTERVNGYVCDKTLFIAKDKRIGTSTMWISKELQWPLKSETKGPQGTMTMDCKNIKTGPLSAALFEIPKGYKKQAMPKMPMMPPGKAR